MAISAAAPAAGPLSQLGDGCRRLTIVSGGRNHIRDYVADILEEARPSTADVPAVVAASSAAGTMAARSLPGPVLLRARLRAMSKAISVAEVAKRCAAEHGIAVLSRVELTGMAEEGPQRRDAPEIYIRLDFKREPAGGWCAGQPQ
mmetsp:Transcript_11540/g.36895  ORF Transcript_11540/g.36895 Transcript_11540/m.36895 type:complete len:146 (+) Transcript_11540:63-500(+)